MRTIKFRAWKQSQKAMFYPVETINIIDLPQVMLEKGDDILMQFTGLLDKNGKEIYEGDIIKDQWSERYTVTFEDGCFYGKYKDREADADINIFHEESIIEVIGNVHENPELT